MAAASPIWFFDLDNTLHDASHRVFPAINSNMNAFIAGVLGEDGMPAGAARVNAARIGYLRRYGATLLGMVRHHQVRPADFLEAAHRFDDLPAMLRAERGIGAMLARLPGQKILLTNAPLQYSTDVLRHFGLRHHFSHHIAIESMRVHGRLQPKPSKALLRKLIARHGGDARRCILVEDTLANLKAARALGMRTVWMTGYLRASGNAPGRTPLGTSGMTSGTTSDTTSDTTPDGTANGPVPAAGNAADIAKTRKRPPYVDVKVQSLKQLFDSLHCLIGK